MANVYVVMYVQPDATGAVSPPPYPMRFDLTIHEWWSNLGCVLPDKTVNPDKTTVQWTVVGQPFGNFAVCTLAVPDGWWGKYQSAQKDHEAVADSLNIAPTQPALAGRHHAIIAAINQQLDQHGTPPAASDFDRAVNGLRGLDFTGHHDRFGMIRDAYLGALTGPSGSYWWLPSFLLLDQPKMTEHDHAIDFDTLGQMRQCMIDHPPEAPCRAVHYLYQLGLLAAYLNTLPGGK